MEACSINCVRTLAQYARGLGIKYRNRQIFPLTLYQCGATLRQRASGIMSCRSGVICRDSGTHLIQQWENVAHADQAMMTQWLERWCGISETMGSSRSCGASCVWPYDIGDNLDTTTSKRVYRRFGVVWRALGRNLILQREHPCYLFISLLGEAFKYIYYYGPK